MPGESVIEKRLAQVERELAELQTQVKTLASPRQNWLDAISGSRKNDPEFAEIVRLGKEIRQADKPEPE